MTRALALAAALALLAGAAQAQNAGQIARAQAGQSCAGCNLFQADLSYKNLSGRSFAGARLRAGFFGTLDRLSIGTTVPSGNLADTTSSPPSASM